MKISESTFIISTNGFADGPAQALRDYLLKKGAKCVTVITHPLVPENDSYHIVETIEQNQSSQRKYKAPNKPPLTYPLDFFIPRSIPEADVWFGFNNLAALKGIRLRNKGRVKKVVYWAVDFVPNRFGKSIATKVYDKVDKKVCHEVDLWVDLSEAARSGRAKYHGLKKRQQAPSVVAPMGAWNDETPKISNTAWSKKRVVYLGHLVQRQGVETLINALKILGEKHKDIEAEIIGSGPELDDLIGLTNEIGLSKRIKFHGFVKSHHDVEKILSGGTVAAAPYKVDEESFTQFADPGKLKAYLGAGLPIVMTPVPPNTEQLRKSGAAIITSDSPEDLAKGIDQLLSNKKLWEKSRQAALSMAQDFDWNKIMRRTLSKIDVS